MTQYLSYGDPAPTMIPDIPAIYFWTLDLTRLQSLEPEDARTELQRVMNLPLRTFDGRASPYYTASITDVPDRLGQDRTNKLVSVLQEGGALAHWLLLYATVLQRPLYVGQAVSLNSRFRAHIRVGSRFRSYLDEAQLRLRDCCLVFIELPRELTAPLHGATLEPEEDEAEEETNLTPTALDVLEALLHRTMRPLLARRIE